MKVSPSRIFKVLLLAALLVGLLPAASIQAQGAKPAKDTLVVAQSADISSLEPNNVASRNESNIMDHMFATLYEVNEKGAILPYLAKSATYTADGKGMTFVLNDGLTCHDGEALTAEDVAYTFNRGAEKANKFDGNTPGFVFDALGFTTATADDALTVTINMKTYNPIALGLLAEVYIHCKDSYSKMSLDQAAKNPIGSGPYKFVEWKKDEYLLMQKVPNFKLREVAFDKVVWRPIPEASTRVAELIAGNVDVVQNVPPDQIKAVDASGVAKSVPVQGTRRMYVGINFNEKYSKTPGGIPLMKKEVRQALQYAIDVPTICSSLLGTECKRATSLVNPPNDNPNLTPYPYDPKKAGELLDKAGYPLKDGVRFETTLQGPRGRYLNDANVVQAIGQYLSDVGIKLTVDIQDWATYRAKLPQHDVGPLFFLGSGGDTWSALYDMADIAEPTGATNYTEWPNPEWFTRWAKLNASRDEKEQRTLINEMLQIMYDDSPWLFLYFQPDFYAQSNRITWTAQADKIHITSAKLK